MLQSCSGAFPAPSLHFFFDGPLQLAAMHKAAASAAAAAAAASAPAASAPAVAWTNISKCRALSHPPPCYDCLTLGPGRYSFEAGDYSSKKVAVARCVCSCSHVTSGA